ncbi:thyroid transcription factor 1-associated protein 26 homolog [Coccinella septempunctata]|uniref:thyroid transcription factor 1-associated protein 26 homolog n=1 Tax=Coccinella septempunctata TaxID=41139 RepID=UPI001D09062A|nr:thyroid transcription factor 1-associated protein 26 homolog [Coccinella septempunctata]
MGKFKRPNMPEGDSNESNGNRKDSFFVKPKITGENKSRVVMQKNKSEGTNSTNRKQFFEDSQEETSKRPFDKKQWRLKKYSNKYKVDKWKETRKKEILNQYHKVAKKIDNKGLDIQKIYERYDKEDSDLDEMNPVNSFTVKTSQPETAPHDEGISEKPKSPKKLGKTSRKTKLQEIEEEKERRRQEYLKKQAEREEALKLMRKKKAERYRRLNKRTKKGQPIMKDRMEMLYEQVQRVCQETE